MPHADPMVIRAAKAAGLWCVPGVATPTEAFAALDAGADALKLFPAELVTPPVVKAMRAVLAGFGLGSSLFTPALEAAAVRANAVAFVAAWRILTAPPPSKT